MKPTNKQLLARALWLAFKASSPMGLGILHSGQAANMTEESLIAAAHLRETDGELRVSTDYVCGRMMKTSFVVSKDGELTVNPEVPRGDYQSWAGTYASATELKAAVVKSFELLPV